MHNRTIVALATAASAIALSACGSDEDRTARPLALTAHVVPPAGLTGFKSTGAVVRQDPATFAKAHDKTTAEVQKTGLVAGATAQFNGTSPGPAQATSVAVQFASTAAAANEAERLYRSNAKPDRGVSVRTIQVPGIPAAKAVELSGKEDGQQLTGVEVVFAHGSVTHELFAFGRSAEISVPTVLAAARTLYNRVKGHPLPGA